MTIVWRRIHLPNRIHLKLNGGVSWKELYFHLPSSWVQFLTLATREHLMGKFVKQTHPTNSDEKNSTALWKFESHSLFQHMAPFPPPPHTYHLKLVCYSETFCKLRQCIVKKL